MEPGLLNSSTALRYLFTAYADSGSEKMSEPAFTQFIEDCPGLLTSDFVIAMALSPWIRHCERTIDFQHFVEFLYQVSLLRYPDSGAAARRRSARALPCPHIDRFAVLRRFLRTRSALLSRAPFFLQRRCNFLTPSS